MSTISYFGGKSSKVFLEFINSKIPKEGFDTYVEPFSGSMATYLDDNSLTFDKVIFNDKNKHQCNLMFCCSKPEVFLEHLSKFKCSVLKTDETEPQKLWDFYKSIYFENTRNSFLDETDFEIGDFEKACMYAFLITSSFSSVYPRGGGFSGFNKERKRLKLEVLIDKLSKNKYTQRLNTITGFFSDDFENVIKKYDSEKTFFYLDPPYFRYDEKTGEDDGRRLFWYGSDKDGVFGPASHRRLLELLKVTKGKWALSYYYFPLLEELLPRTQFNWYDKEVNRSSALGGNNHAVKQKPAKGTELLILNY
jgi:site-specific DNA-adenine methylase